MARQSSSISRATAIVLLGLTILLLAARFHSYTEALERDITTYAVIAEEMLRGRQLYTDLWDHKPPAIYLSFAVARLLTPSLRTAVFLANSVASVAILLGVFVVGSAGTRRVVGGLFSATVWVVVSGNLWLQGNQPNTEVFLNACLIWAFAFVLRAARPGHLILPVLTAGVLFAAATLYKQTTVVVAAAMAAALVLRWRLGLEWECTASNQKPPPWRRVLTAVALLAAPGFIAWLGTFSYFAARGRFDDLYSAVFLYNRSYAGDILENMTALWRLAGAIPEPAAPTIGILLTLAVIGCAADLGQHPVRWLMCGAYLVAVSVVIVIPGPLYPHYFQLLLPPLVVAAGWAVVALRDLRSAWAPLASTSIACLALAALLWHEIPNYRLSAERWSRLKYGPLFIDSHRLGKELDQILPDGSTFYELGAETGLYFSSGRRPPSGVFYDYPLIRSSPIQDELARRVVADLTREEPALVVVRVGRPVHPLIHAWVSQRYVLDGEVELPPGFALLRPIRASTTLQ